MNTIFLADAMRQTASDLYDAKQILHVLPILNLGEEEARAIANLADGAISTAQTLLLRAAVICEQGGRGNCHE